MKLVFALIVILNGNPQDTTGMYFMSAEACNQMAFRTEKGIVSEKLTWSSNKNVLHSYCVPRRVPVDAETYDDKIGKVVK